MVKIQKNYLKISGVILIGLIVAFMGYSYFTQATYSGEDAPKPVFGDEDAKVEIVEFGDIQCPACKRANPVVNRIKEEYKDNISFQFYHFPLVNVHPYAQQAAEATECANDQGKFWEYLDAAYQVSPELTRDNLNEIARGVGLNMTMFNNCLDSRAKESDVQQDYQYGRQQNVRSTPTFLVNGEKLDSWRYNNFKQKIEAELE